MKHLQHPIVAEPQVQYVLKTKMGFGAFTFEGVDAEDRARKYRDDRPDRNLILIKRTVLEEEVV